MVWTPRLTPVLVIVGAGALAALLFVVGPMTRNPVLADCSASSPCPTPTPTPTNAFLSLDVTDGGPTTQITVNGGAFLPNEQMTLYWDSLNKVAGSGVADGSGNFVTHVKPFAGDAPGVHKLCASVPPNPCANFTLEAATPTPSPSPTPTESPSPSASPEATAGATASPTPIAATLNGFDVISRPPFVFLPIVGLIAIALSLGYWVLSVVRRPRPVALPSAAVVHRATRPDYSAGFGTPPPQATSAAPEPSAWADVPQAATPAGAPATEPPAAPELEPPAPTWDTEANPTAWGTGEPDTGYQFAPPEQTPDTGDLPEPGE
ncbi:MAG TPA: hypothetical protein VEU76_10245 [Candidatus Udaeobacter sp.]|nr:hypothetical protein [Candidatus Udaeobacter sp.]